MLHGEGLNSEETEVAIMRFIAYLPISEQKLQECQAANANDVGLQTSRQTILKGWPDES